MNVARRIVATHDAGQQRVRGGLGARRHHRRAAGAWPTRSRPSPPSASWTCCSRPASASAAPCWPWRSTRLGCEAVSFTGSQAGIVTDTVPHQGQDRGHLPLRVEQALADGRIVLVAGFQGVRRARTSPPWAAAAPTPRPWPWPTPWAPTSARSTPTWTASTRPIRPSCRQAPQARTPSPTRRCSRWRPPGAQVLALRSVEYARKYDVPIHVRSSFTDAEGTWVEGGKMISMEQAIVSGVDLHDRRGQGHRARRARPGPAWRPTVFSALADAHVNVDMIIQNVGEPGHTDISCTVPVEDMPPPARRSTRSSRELRRPGLRADDTIGKVSLIGAGMRTHPGVAARMFRTLADLGINLEMISTSPIKISCVIAQDRVEEAVRALHDAFDLDEGSAVAHEPADRGALERDERRRPNGGRAWPSSAPPGSWAARCAPSSSSATFPCAELRLLASERSAGRTLPFGGAELAVAELSARRLRGRRPRVLRRRRRREPAVRAGGRGGGRHGDRQVQRVPHGPDVPLVVPEVNAEHLASPQRHHRHAQLLDHPDGGGAQAAPRRGRHRARRRVDLPGGVGQRQARHRRAGRAGPRLGDRREPVPAFYPRRIAFNLLPHIDSFLPPGTPRRSRRW